jgi:hypothetical protein
MHFPEEIKLSEDSPVLLILDCPYSRTLNVELIEINRKNQVTIASLHIPVLNYWP